MDVEQQRITERDADERDRVCDAQRDDPVGMWQSEQTAQRHYQVAAVPAHHTRCQGQQQPLNRHQPDALSQEHVRQPQRQNRSEAVADQLECFEQGHCGENTTGRVARRLGAALPTNSWAQA